MKNLKSTIASVIAVMMALFVATVPVMATDEVMFPNFYEQSQIKNNVPTINNSTISSQPIRSGNGIKKNEVIGQYSTEFSRNAKGRNHNIKMSSIAIDQYVINPGETFSFNEVVGYASEANGYMKSTIFVDGKEVKAYGGGICQVSSTLYNAALEAGMEIIERHPHSKRVYYVPEGKDAATSYNGVDLKFKNNFDFPVTINTYVSDNVFTSEIIK